MVWSGVIGARPRPGLSGVLSLMVLGAAAVLGAALVVAGPRWGAVLGIAAAAMAATAVQDGAARLALVLIPSMALIRRLTGGPDAYVANDPLILLVPLLLVPALVGLPLTRLDPRLGRTRAIWLGLLMWSALVTVAVPGMGLTVRIFGLLTVLVPALVGYAVFEGLYPRLPRAALTSALLLGPLAAAYGLVQYVLDPPWDLAWLADRQEEIISIGAPEHGGYRIFGTMEAPLPFALYLGLALVAMAAWALWPPQRRPHASMVVLGVAGLVTLAALLLTATRSVLFGLPLVAVVAVLLLPGRRRLPALIIAALLSLATLVIPALAADSLYDDERQANRLRVGEVGEDTSLLARLDLLGQFGQVLQAPWGTGLGSSGQATVLDTGEAIPNIDNGYLALAQETGLVGICLFIFLIYVALSRGRAALGVSGRPDFALGGSYLTVLYFAVLLLTGSVLSGSSALLFWIALGALTRQAALSAAVEQRGAAAEGVPLRRGVARLPAGVGGGSAQRPAYHRGNHHLPDRRRSDARS